MARAIGEAHAIAAPLTADEVAGEDVVPNPRDYLRELCPRLSTCVVLHALDSRRVTKTYSLFVLAGMCCCFLFTWNSRINLTGSIVLTLTDLVYLPVWVFTRNYVSQSDNYFYKQASKTFSKDESREKRTRRFNCYLWFAFLVTFAVGASEKAIYFKDFLIDERCNAQLIALSIYGSVTFFYRLHLLFVVLAILRITLLSHDDAMKQLCNDLPGWVISSDTDLLFVLREFTHVNSKLMDASQRIGPIIFAFVCPAFSSFLIVTWCTYSRYIGWSVFLSAYDYVVTWILSMLVLVAGAKTTAQFRMPYHVLHAVIADCKREDGSKLHDTFEQLKLLMDHLREHATPVTALGMSLEPSRIVQFMYMACGVIFVILLRLLPGNRS